MGKEKVQANQNKVPKTQKHFVVLESNLLPSHILLNNHVLASFRSPAQAMACALPSPPLAQLHHCVRSYFYLLFIL